MNDTLLIYQRLHNIPFSFPNTMGFEVNIWTCFSFVSLLSNVKKRILV